MEWEEEDNNKEHKLLIKDGVRRRGQQGSMKIAVGKKEDLLIPNIFKGYWDF